MNIEYHKHYSQYLGRDKKDVVAVSGAGALSENAGPQQALAPG